MTANPSGDPPPVFSEEYHMPVAAITSPTGARVVPESTEMDCMTTMPPVDKPRRSNIKARIISQD
jgi:hypothetical protein